MKAQGLKYKKVYYKFWPLFTHSTKPFHRVPPNNDAFDQWTNETTLEKMSVQSTPKYDIKLIYFYYDVSNSGLQFAERLMIY